MFLYGVLIMGFDVFNAIFEDLFKTFCARFRYIKTGNVEVLFNVFCSRFMQLPSVVHKHAPGFG